MKKNKNLIIFILITITSFLAYVWFIDTPVFQEFISWAQQNFWTYFFVLTFLKFLAIVWPPIPGGLLTLGSIPIIGWKHAFLADALGGLLGASVAYFLGKRYGYPFLRKLFDEKAIEKIKKVKIKKGRETEAVIVYRLIFGTVSEVISYGSGLIGIKFPNFLIGTLSNTLVQVVIFYIAKEAFSGQNLVINVVAITAAVLLFYKLKGRYFE